MSHPNPSHDRSNEYPSDHYKPAKSKALKKRVVTMTGSGNASLVKRALGRLNQEKDTGSTETSVRSHKGHEHIRVARLPGKNR